VAPDSNAQSASIKGRVFDRYSNEAIPFANVYIDSLYIGTTSDVEGNYVLKDLNPGTYNIVCSFVGYKMEIQYEVRVSAVKTTTLDFAMESSKTNLSEVKIVASPFSKREESPLSLRTLSAAEIYRNPGGNRDISKVIQILPGVATTLSFRNDLIVRGGAPNENRFYIDGIEVPNINHFATQGSSGGPVGLINVNLIREVDFYAGAFPASRGNALSSILEFKSIEGNKEKLKGNFMIGSSDAGITLDGPMGSASSFVLSIRRSYLNFLFKALSLPFLPTYNDLQYSQNISLNNKNRITILALGAFDEFALNESVNDKVSDEKLIERNNYILGYLPVNNQWNYTAGIKWRHFFSGSYLDIIVSRNHLNNQAEKYQNNIVNAENLILDYQSEEIENKLRVENTFRIRNWKWISGLGYEIVEYQNSTINRIQQNGIIQTIDYTTNSTFKKFFAFTQISKNVLSERLSLSLGLRTDWINYSSSMKNAFDQLSPRLSASYLLMPNWNINFNIGRYYQLPSYTMLGYKNNAGETVNKLNGLKYISSDHIVAGIEYRPTLYSKMTVEGFLKSYNNYPYSIKDSISLANLGADFGVVGNEEVRSISQGRSYGIEFLAQQKLSSSIYGTLAYTWVRSEFGLNSDDLSPSSWDNRHILNLTAGKKLSRQWELAFRFRWLGGAPYTPYDVELSSIKSIWDINRQGIPDWSKLNSLRNANTHSLDIRIDKTYYLKKFSLNIYVDVQNVYNSTTALQPFIDIVRDTDGNPVGDPQNTDAYLLKEIENSSGSILPSIGIMLEF